MERALRKRVSGLRDKVSGGGGGGGGVARTTKVSRRVTRNFGICMKNARKGAFSTLKILKEPVGLNSRRNVRT